MRILTSKIKLSVPIIVAVLTGVLFLISRSESHAQGNTNNGYSGYPLVSLWDYKFVAADDYQIRDKALERFNALGLEGWEFSGLGTPAKDQGVVAVFKRRH